RRSAGGRGQAPILPKETRPEAETERDPSRRPPRAAARVPTRGEGSRRDMETKEPVRKNRVRELRENRLMTQAQLARKAKVALRTIHSVEKGMNCRMDTKRKILLALGMRFEDKDYVFPPIGMSASSSQDPMQQHG